MKARLLTWFCLLTTQGCVFSERSYPYDPAMRVRIAPPSAPAGGTVSARQWLAQAEAQLARLLPAHRKTALLTDQLVTPDGLPADVVGHFEIKTGQLESIFVNFFGLAYSAQAIMPDRPPSAAPPWKDFEDVWIPVAPDLQLSARLGWARDADGRVIDADCVVILPGIRGDNNILRVRDLAAALRGSGLHVLSLEVRGAGRTDLRYPQFEFTWGIFEADDLLRVADWLQAIPHVRRTGLVGYSWGANLPMLAAWADGRTSDEGIPPRLRAHLNPAPRGPRRYEAGMIAFSPIIRFEPLMDKLMVEQPVWLHPVLASLQGTIRTRMTERHYPNPCGSIRELIKHLGIGYDGEVEDGLEYLRLLPYKLLPAHDRLNSARVPLLIVHAADDMLGGAQDIPDLLATVRNPNVAAIVLPTGGHIGFGPYAPAWYYDLILNYFDPVVGVAAGRSGPASSMPQTPRN
ncbi:MAG TPA: alpha/beta fold hydrolase [Phycisphaerae bacterium]|nr:alpha/beta fold hydrolase [Phycisphaerae bacterium]